MEGDDEAAVPGEKSAPRFLPSVGRSLTQETTANITVREIKWCRYLDSLTALPKDKHSYHMTQEFYS